jgi:hypothetical protein
MQGTCQRSVLWSAGEESTADGVIKQTNYNCAKTLRQMRGVSLHAVDPVCGNHSVSEDRRCQAGLIRLTNS